MKYNTILCHFKRGILLVMFLGLFVLRSSAQLTNANTAGNWEAYTGGGTPPVNWLTSTSAANWGTASTAAQNNWQECLHNTSFGLPNPVCNGNNGTTTNYIWGPTAGGTAYLRYIIPGNVGCTRYFLKYAVDNIATIWVNGVQVSTSNNWQTRTDVEITQFLNCTNNVIAAQVTDLNGPYFFIANLTNQPVNTTTITATADEIDCENPVVSLHATAVEGATYLWTFPNGTTSNLREPSFPANPRSAWSGTYTCTITLNSCCTITRTVNITIPENCCSAEITYTRANCNDFNFTFSSAFVNVNCLYWIVDDVVVQANGNTLNRTLGPGTHTICVQYLGTTKKNPNEICCQRVCITVTIPEVIEETLNRSYCDFDTYTGLEPSQLFSGYNHYKLRKLPATTGYDSRNGGNTWHAIDQGTWILEYFDASGCLLKRITINVTVTGSSTVNCNQSIIVNCGTQADLNSYFAGCACNFDPLTADLEVGPWTLIGTGPIPGSNVTFNQSGVYEQITRDFKNCIVCIKRLQVSVLSTVVSSTLILNTTPCELMMLNSLPARLGLPDLCTHADDYEVSSIDLTNGTIVNFTINRFTTVLVFCCNHKYIFRAVGNPCCVNEINVVCGGGQQMMMPENKERKEDISSYFFGNNGVIQAPAENNTAEAKPVKLAELKLELVPNPTSAEFRINTVNYSSEVFDKVEIFSSTGAVVNTFENVGVSNLYNLTGNASGVYLVRVKAGNAYFQLRLLLQ